jgi:hypothetical protein
MKRNLVSLNSNSSNLFKLSNNMYRCKTILAAVLSGHETWSFDLREEHKIQVSEIEVLRKICGCKSDEVSGQFKIFYEELG